MRIAIITPALPPQLDGIGDHSAYLARELSRTVEVELLGPIGISCDSIDGVKVTTLFRPDCGKSIETIGDHIARTRPDWVMLQYNPFAYGKWGFCPALARMFRQIQRRSPATRTMLMVHERFVPIISCKFALMTIWQRWQFRQLGSAADVILSSIEAWAKEYRRWFRNKPVLHLPVGSNIPRIVIDREEARRRLGIEPETMVLGLFGTHHQSRRTAPIRNAAESAIQAGHKILILYIGPHAETAERELAGLPVRAEGPVSPEEVSRRLAAVDVFLAAFGDGVSTRRGSVIAALQHGLPCVCTQAWLTDSLFHDADGDALLLADAADPRAMVEPTLRALADASLRARLSEGAKRLFASQFAWERISERILNVMNGADHQRASHSGLYADRLACIPQS